MSSSEALTDCSLEPITFSTMPQSQQRGPIMSLIFTWIFSKTLSWLISSLLADPRLSFSMDMAKSSSFLTWSALSSTGFFFNMLESTSLYGRHSSKCSFVKEAIDFDILYLKTTPYRKRSLFLTFLEILYFLQCFWLYLLSNYMWHNWKVTREVGEVRSWRCFSYFVSWMLESKLKCT